MTNDKTDSDRLAMDNASNEIAVYEYSFDLEGVGSASRVARLIGKNKTILEVGCGPGSQSKVFHGQLGCDVVGIEIDPDRAEKARIYCRDVHVANLEIDDLSDFLKNERFDVIVCADVLEHLRNPGDLLVRLKDYLKSDGYLVASIPNVTHASIVYEMIHGRFEYKTEGLLDSTHVKLFSCASALSLIEGAGYWIAELQKASKIPKHTEFKSNPIGDEDKLILAAIASRNPDANTYQFVIKAHPLNSSAVHDGNAYTMREEIRQLQGKISSYESQLQKLNAALNWYRKPFFARLMKKFNAKSK